MNRLKLCKIIILLGLGFASITAAAELGEYNKQDTSYPVPDSVDRYYALRAPLTSQSFYYFGLGAGVDVHSLKYTLTATLPPYSGVADDTVYPLSFHPGIYGGIGKNYDHFYLGLEALVNYNFLYRRPNFNLQTPFFAPNSFLSIRENISAGLDLMPGYLTESKKFLFYGRLGGAVGNYNAKLTANSGDPNNPFSKTVNQLCTGIRAGLGMEYYMEETFSLRLEYVYTVYSNFDSSIDVLKPYPVHYAFNIKPSTNQLNFGITMRFNFD